MTRIIALAGVAALLKVAGQRGDLLRGFVAEAGGGVIEAVVVGQQGLAAAGQRRQQFRQLAFQIAGRRRPRRGGAVHEFQPLQAVKGGQRLFQLVVAPFAEQRLAQRHGVAQAQDVGQQAAGQVGFGAGDGVEGAGGRRHRVERAAQAQLIVHCASPRPGSIENSRASNSCLMSSRRRQSTSNTGAFRPWAASASA